MSIGAILVGLAAALVVAAFIVQPLRRRGDVERLIEGWVAQARAQERTSAGEQASAEEPVAFCPQCGRRAGPEDRFCARCGRPLRGGDRE